MNDKAIKQARQKLTPFVEDHISEPLRRAYSWLAASRESDGGWGRLPSSVSEIRTTCLALMQFVRDNSYLRAGEFEDSVQYVRNALQPGLATSTQSNTSDIFQSITIEELGQATCLLASIENSRNKTLLASLQRYLSANQQEDGGWGHVTSRSDITATVVYAFTMSSKDLLKSLDRAITYLESIINSDGGVGISKDKPSTIVHTAKVLSVLVHAKPDAPANKQAARFLLSRQIQTDGSWAEEDQGDAIYSTALSLRALLGFGVDTSDPSIQKAARFLLGHQDSAGGWGWSVGSISEVEPTALVIDALVRAGITEYVPVVSAIEVLKSTLEENVAMRAQNEAISSDIENQVQERIRNIINNKDLLEQRVSQLETENRRLSRQQAEVERLRQETAELPLLRAERLELREILDEATNLIAGYGSTTPTRILSRLEDLLVQIDLVKDPMGRDVIYEVLTSLQRANSVDKVDLFSMARHRLSVSYPPNIVDRLISYASAIRLPMSPDVERALDQLIERVRRGSLRHSTRRRTSTADNVISSLDTSIAMFADADRSAALDLLRFLVGFLPDIPNREAKEFGEHVSQRYLRGAYLPTSIRERVLRSIEEVASLRKSESVKERIREALTGLQLRLS